MHFYVYCHIIDSSQHMEATKVSYEYVDKEEVVHIHNGIFSHNKGIP